MRVWYIMSNSRAPKGVEPKNMADGSANPKYVDVLDEDKAVAGQKFVCISFISPEKIIKDKNVFLFEEFLKQWELKKGLEKYTQFLHYISYKYSVNFDTLSEDLQEFAKSEKDSLQDGSVLDEYKTFLDKNEDKLGVAYDEQHQFQTSTRGVKIRGSYPSQAEAELRAKVLREADPNHDVYVGPVGMWMPYHPEAYKTGRVEYLEDELNQLMHEKNKNEAKAKQEFEDRVKEAKRAAIEENKKKALESGNVLTQTIDKEGNLVSVKDVSNPLELGDEVTAADIRKELFEDENVVTSQGDHGLSRLPEERKKELGIEDDAAEDQNQTAVDASGIDVSA